MEASYELTYELTLAPLIMADKQNWRKEDEDEEEQELDENVS